MAHIQQQTPESIVLAGVYYSAVWIRKNFHISLAKIFD